MTQGLRLCGAALLAAALTAVIRRIRPDFAPLLAAAAGLFLTVGAVSVLMPLLTFVRDLADPDKSGGAIPILLRGAGVTLTVQTVSDLCRDMGEGAVADKLEWAGRAQLLLLALPLLREVVDMAVSLAGGGA